MGISLIHSCASLIRAVPQVFFPSLRLGLYLKPKILHYGRTSAHSRSVSATEAYRKYFFLRRSLSPQGHPIGHVGFYHRLRSLPGIPAREFPRRGWYHVPFSGGLPCTRSVARKQKKLLCVLACISFSLRLSHPSSV